MDCSEGAVDARNRSTLIVTPDRVRIRPDAWIAAYVLQRFSPLVWRPHRNLYFASRFVADPAVVRIPTRHGLVRCLIYRPPAGAPALGAPGRLPPVHLQIHGGGFYGRFPAQDEHLAKYIASDVGAIVVCVDYDVAPQVQFPVAEEECYDVATWMHGNASSNGWDAQRISVGGASAGGKLAINVCQIAHANAAFRLRALVAAYAVADVTRTDRASANGNANLSQWIQRLVNRTYFADPACRAEPIASPLLDERLADAVPATLIITGEYDALAPEMDGIAQTLRAAGVAVIHRRFPGVDHGFTHAAPVASAREAIGLIGAFLRAAYTVA
jgi:acetyl esterase/lipase